MPYPSSTLYPATSGVYPEVGDVPVVITPPYRAPDDRLSITVQHADGRVSRWSHDEVDGRNIPTDLTFGTSIPGGYGTGQCSLLRRLDQDHPDQDLFDLVTVHGPGGRIAYQGYAIQFPRSHGDSYSITPGMVGPSASLRWDPSFREIYVDRDIAQWRDPPFARREAVLVAAVSMGDFAWTIADGGATVALPNQALGTQTLAEVWYSMPPGLTVSAFQYLGGTTGTLTSWTEKFATSDNENAVGGESYAWTLNGSAQSQALSTVRRYLYAQVYSNGTATTPTAGTSRRLSKLAVFGNHGLTRRTVSGDLDGLYASDVVANVISRAAPLLNYTTGTGGSIEPTAFAIPHLAYRDPVTAEFVVSDVNKYHLYDWGVYDNLEFFYRQPDPDRLCWEARLGDGAHMDADGLTGEQVINGVFVTYTDPTGVTKTVGPPGGNFDATDASLEDTSSSNPANSHGIPAKWDQLTLSFPATQAGAVQIGAVYLAERSLATRRGSLTLTGTVQHPTEGKVPVWRVRAGDWIRVTDLNGENASVQRKCIETSYSHANRSVRLSLDNTVAQVESILARVGVMAGIQGGGGF